MHELRLVNRLGQLIAPLPEVKLGSASWDLDPSKDVMDFTISPVAPNSQYLDCNKVECQLWIDNALRWWGVVREIGPGNSQQVAVKCEGLMSEFGFRFILEEDLVFTNVDQISVGAALVNYAQDPIQGTNPDLHIGIAGYSLSGTLMTRTYTSDRKGSIVEPLRDLATVEGGFEQSIEIFGNGTRLWTPWFPQRGSQKPNRRLEYGRNIIDFNWRKVGQSQATKIDATGGTAEADPFDPFGGREKQNFIYEDTALSAEYGVHIGVLPSGAKSDLDWLERRARRAVATRGRPVEITGVTCQQGGRYPELMTVMPGDEVPVKIDRGMIQVAEYHRVKSKKWYPNNRVEFEFTSVID